MIFLYWCYLYVCLFVFRFVCLFLGSFVVHFCPNIVQCLDSLIPGQKIFFVIAIYPHMYELLDESLSLYCLGLEGSPSFDFSHQCMF